MKTKLITICLVGFLVFFGSCGKREPQKEPNQVEVEKEAVEEKLAEEKEAEEAKVEIAEPNVVEPNVVEPTEMRKLKEFRGPRFGRERPWVSEVNEIAEPNELVALNLKYALMKDIIEKIAELAEPKAIIPATDEIMNQKITVYAAKKVPRSEALMLIYAALKARGINPREVDGVIFLEPITGAKVGMVPTIAAEEPLTEIEDKNKVVQKFFKLENYSVTQLSQILRPLISEYGYISADESTRQLLVVDTVANLMRLEQTISQLDIPGAEQTEIRIFKIPRGDPSEIVQILYTLLGQQLTSAQRSRIEQLRRTSPFGGPSGIPSFPSTPRSSSSRSSNPSSSNSDGNPDGRRARESILRGARPEVTPEATPESKEVTPEVKAVTPETRARVGVGALATSVAVGAGDAQVVLIPDQRRKVIIARAGPSDMEIIADVINKLAQLDIQLIQQYDVITIEHVDVDEVVSGVNRILQGARALPTAEITVNVVVSSVARSKQLLVFGSEDDRNWVKAIVKELDIPSATLFETRTFTLKHISCEEVKEKIDELYGAGAVGIAISRVTPSRKVSAIDEVRTVAYSALNQLTVIASPSNLKMIAQQIEEWDVPLDVEKVKPLIIELKNLDPEEMADLFTTLFSAETTGATRVIQQLRGERTEAKREIVGPLYGQITVEAIPKTKKIIIISKTPEAYKVIEEIVRELDKKEPAELPRLVILKYADPEDLAERLNALFNEPGTAARIRRTEKELTYTLTTTTEEQQAAGQQQAGQQVTTTNEYTPWWSGSGARVGVGEQMPISNVIGRIRIVPEPRSKAILVIAHPEYLDEIEKMIAEMDKPGKQVMIQAIVVEVDKSKLHSIGMQLASSPSAFGTLGENLITALSQITQSEKHGALIFGADNKSGSSFALNANTNITVLLDFLVKKTNAKILNQQTLWTKDNKSAAFFKGQEISLIADSSVSGTGIVTQSFTRNKFGMTLNVRPNITPEKNVDMTMNLSISQLLTQELVNTQPTSSLMETFTNIIVQDGQTILQGRILLQEDSNIERKLPLLSDIPVIGKIFQHNNFLKFDNELLVFITPYVVDEESKPDEIKEVKNAKDKMEKVITELDEMSKWLENIE